MDDTAKLARLSTSTAIRLLIGNRLADRKCSPLFYIRPLQLRGGLLTHRNLGHEIMKIVVTYWAGTTQKTKSVNSYSAAKRLVDKEHRNAYSPIFETVDGETLVDTGSFFVTEAEAAKSNPVAYA